MKLPLSLILLFSTLSSLGQTEQTLQSLVSKKNFQNLQAFVDSAADQSNRGIADIQWSLKRDLLPGYQEAVVKLHLSTGSTDHRHFRIKLLATDTDIFYYEFTGSGKEADQPFIDKQAYQQFEKAFLAAYYAPLNKDDLFQNITFGAGCGIAGTMPDHMLQLVFHLQNDDGDAVLSWLRSANTEKQLYALQGMKAMQLNGYDLTDEDRAVIKTIKKKKEIDLLYRRSYLGSIYYFTARSHT